MVCNKDSINRIKIVFISFIVFLFFISFLYGKEENKTNRNNNKIYTINLENYIYEKLGLKPEEYKFKKISNNPYGNVVYAYTIYKARGTLLININIPQNVIGYRVLNDIKEVSDISIGYDNTILLNTLAGKNQFYYLSLKGDIKFDSPSFNTSMISTFPNGFYWLGFKYSDLKTKKLESKQQFLFIYIKEKINSYDLSFIRNKIKSKTFNVFVFNKDNLVVQEYNKGLSNLYIVDLKTKGIKEIEKNKEIVMGNFVKDKFYYLKYDDEQNKVFIKEVDTNNLSISDKFSMGYKKDNYMIFNLNVGYNEFMINKGMKQGNVKSIFYDFEGDEFYNIENEKIYPILYSNNNRIGFYYLFKNAIEIHNLRR